MKKHIYIFFILLSLGLGVSAQQKNYIPYLKAIVYIEEQIAEEDFSKALVLYQHLFEDYSKVFARDAFNACQLAALSDTSKFRYFFHHCARAGVPLKVLTNNKHINKLLQTTTLDTLYRAGHTHFLTTIDSTLRKEFLQRFKEEQNSKAKNNYKEVVQANFNRILQLAQEGRFPDEGRIGTDDELENSMLSATLKHYPWSFLILNTYIQRSLTEGGMQPVGAYYIYGFNQTRTSILYKPNEEMDAVFFKKCYNLPFGKTSSNHAEVNRNRSMVYIYSLATEAKLRTVMQRYQLDLKSGY